MNISTISQAVTLLGVLQQWGLLFLHSLHVRQKDQPAGAGDTDGTAPRLLNRESVWNDMELTKTSDEERDVVRGWLRLPHPPAPDTAQLALLGDSQVARQWCFILYLH